MNQSAAKTIAISHFSDALCVWAYIAQIRIAELQANFPGQVELNYHFLQVFGDVAGKMANQWADRGGIEGYAAHVQEAAAQFEHITLGAGVWLDNTPTSSLPAHLVLCGLRALAGADPAGVPPDAAERGLLAIRHAFFVEVADVSSLPVLLDVVRDAGLDAAGVQMTLETGLAHAGLSADLTAAAQAFVRSSPTLTFNEGRQVLAGNVSYRVLEANIRELLQRPGDIQSWC
jgi:predicted DsbA family dithiol-disulfide isomerase